MASTTSTYADPQFWDNIAERYAAKPVANLPVYRRKVAATKERLTPDAVVLDIGCGTGSLVLELAPLVSEIHGVDVSGEMVRIANQKTAAQGVQNATFHKANLDEVTLFEDKRFDVICAYNILHLVADRDDTLRMIFRLLKPGGSLISSTPCIGGGFVPFGLILPVMRWFGKAPRVQLLKTSQIDESLRGAGFVDLQKPEIGAPKRTAFVLATKPA